jgi:hypothetical protein
LRLVERSGKFKAGIGFLDILRRAEKMRMNRDNRRRFAVSPARRLMLFLIAQIFCIAMAQGQSPEMIGSWKIDITFADGTKRALRFDAQGEGKGTFLVLDPRLKAWGPGKPSEAKWTRAQENSVLFSGPAEFLLGNVGRDAGTLTFKGRFEDADSITGEVDFAPLVGERPSKHGTFKATRGNSAH